MVSYVFCMTEQQFQTGDIVFFPKNTKYYKINIPPDTRNYRQQDRNIDCTRFNKWGGMNVNPD